MLWIKILKCMYRFEENPIIKNEILVYFNRLKKEIRL